MILMRLFETLPFRIIKAAIMIPWAIFSGMPMRVLELFGQIFPDNSWGCRIRGTFYRPFMKSCGKNFQVALQAKLEHPKEIEVGENVYIGHGSWISGLRGGVCFEDEVMLGPFVRMVSSNHTFRNGSARFAPGEGGRIVIKKGTWVAGGVTVLAGVSVGVSCLLAAGCVVTENVDDGLCVGGIPAKAIGKTGDYGHNVEPPFMSSEK